MSGNKDDFEFLKGLRNGGSISIASNSELLEILEESEWKVPGRKNGRENRHRERYCFQSYLKKRVIDHSLTFPLKLAVQNAPDSPDFLIEMPHRQIGIEHTDAGHPALDGKIFPNEDGYMNKEEISYWMYDMKYAVLRKILKLQNYCECNSYDLIIYDNSGFVLGADQFESGLSKIRLFYQRIRCSLNPERLFADLWIVNDQGASRVYGLT